MSLGFEDVTRGHLVNARAEVNNFIDSNMQSNYDRLVIPEIKAVARATNAPEAFVESFYFVKTGKNKGKIINTLGTKQNPLARYFNYGTKRNYPITPKVQHPPGGQRAARDKEEVGEGKVLHPSKLRWVDPQTGQVRFADIVIHPGFPRTLAMEIGLKSAQPLLIAQVKNQVKNKFSDKDEQ
jgi:hypothetical protein